MTSEAWTCPSGPLHPAAELLPMMPDAEIDELAQDIAANGLLEPLVFWADNTAQKDSGQHWGLQHCPTYLLDGRSRLAAIERVIGKMTAQEAFRRHLEQIR